MSVRSTSKFLSLVLRHRPEVIGLELDKNGWADIQDLIEKYNANRKDTLNMDILCHVVRTNNKKRFAISPDRLKIRASQGHSIDVDLGYSPVTPPDVLYHGTADSRINGIKKKGILRSGRHHVHLSRDKDTAKVVGGRHGTPCILTIDAKKMYEDGHVFFISDNEVWLTDNVPWNYITCISFDNKSKMLSTTRI